MKIEALGTHLSDLLQFEAQSTSDNGNVKRRRVCQQPKTATATGLMPPPGKLAGGAEGWGLPACELASVLRTCALQLLAGHKTRAVTIVAF